MILSYTSYRSGPNGKQLPRLVARGWRQLISASAPCPQYMDRYALDNGAWAAHAGGYEWSPDPFARLVDAMGGGADWVVLPDIVGGGPDSLSLSLEWIDRLSGLRLIPVQDGMVPEDVEPHIGPNVGLFLGGRTEWKVRTATEWGQLARRVGCYLHVGRVNTRRRIRLCHHIGADSFDGTSPLMFPSTLDMITRARDECLLPLTR